MKKIGRFLIAAFFLSIVLVMVQSASVLAEGDKGSTSENWMEKKMEKMTTTLSLSDDQATQIEALMAEKMEKKTAAKEDYSAKVKALLDDEQKIKYDEMKAKHHKGSMKGSGQDHKGSTHEMKGSGNEHGGSDFEMKGSGNEHGGSDLK